MHLWHLPTVGWKTAPATVLSKGLRGLSQTCYHPVESFEPLIPLPQPSCAAKCGSRRAADGRPGATAGSRCPATPSTPTMRSHKHDCLALYQAHGGIEPERVALGGKKAPLVGVPARKPHHCSKLHHRTECCCHHNLHSQSVWALDLDVGLDVL